tara:strand:+ start:778 stop:1866 length:1089 start_codon:yes stop_codon:yes gene_type:complete
MSSKPILIMAGGTGGHVYPALAVAILLRSKSKNILWLGTHRGLEAQLVPNAGIDLQKISIKGLRKKGLMALICAPFQLAWALIQSLTIMIRYRPSLVIGMGGFVSGPGGIAAWLTRRPLLIHEQNAVAGATNGILATFAQVVLQAFPSTFDSKISAKTVGNPVRQDITNLPSPSERYSPRKGRIRLLILGGSQGALSLNKKIPAGLGLIDPEKRPIVRHQCGERTFDIAHKAYKDYDVDAELIPFINEMKTAYSWADLVICRAGALTVAELCAAGLPAIFIPYPSAVDDHQTANAKLMTEAGAAITIQEHDFTPELLVNILNDWLQSRSFLLKKANKARSLAQPDSLVQITNICLENIGSAS